ncbi:DUF2207 domain-containing protein [Kiritimatiellota bacterium B12222]|nr:DUF2207 domain-containing protein [Kiritimatiellota bacterium B12222]
MRLILFWLCFSLTPLFAELFQQIEWVEAYDVDLELQEDGVLLIEESILIHSAGGRVRHGIYRDFPLRSPNGKGGTQAVTFQLLEVTANEEAVAWHYATQAEGLRLYIGDEKKLFPPGLHEFGIRYQTDRQVIYGKEEDLLRLNAIGHKWSFPIEQAHIRIKLPESFAGQEVQFQCWTGAKGRRKREATMERVSDREFVITLEKPLFSNEGITFELIWEAGLIHPGNLFVRMGRLLKSDWRHQTLIRIAGGGLLMSFMLYFVCWIWVGRDRKAFVEPRPDLPEGMGAAAVRYVMNMGYDNTCLATALTGLASKGRLEIVEHKRGVFTLRKGEAQGYRIYLEEKWFLEDLFDDGKSTVPLKGKGAEKLILGKASVEQALKQNWGHTFRTHRRFLVPGILCGCFTAIKYGDEAYSSDYSITLLLLLIWMVSAVSLVPSFKTRLASRNYRIHHWLQKGLLLFGGILWGMLGFWIMKWMAVYSSWNGTFLLVAQFPLLLLFQRLMKAPTKTGKPLRDHLAGVEKFLKQGHLQEALREERLTSSEALAMYPYALAFGVENQWLKDLKVALAEGLLLGLDELTIPGYRGAEISGAEAGIYGLRYRFYSRIYGVGVWGGVVLAYGSTNGSGFLSDGSSHGAGGGGFSGGGGGGGGGFSGGGGGGGGGGGW